MTAPNDKRQLLYGESTAILDADVLSSINLTSINLTTDCTAEFCSKYKDWILQGVLGQDHAGQPSMREDPEYHGRLE